MRTRLVIISKKEARMAIVQDDGLRISVYAYTDVDLAKYGEPLWQINDLIT